MAEPQPIQITPEIQKKINDLYQRTFGRDVDPSGLQTYGAWMMSGGSESQITNDLKKSSEYVTNVAVPALYWDTLGREPDAGGLQAWSNYMNGQVQAGISPDDLYKQSANVFRSSEEYKLKGGTVGEATRDLVNIQEQAGLYPEFEWGDAQKEEVKKYAEAVYGKYYSDKLDQLIKVSDLQKTRTGEDLTYSVQQATQQLNDYVLKSDEEKSRINEDYDKAMFQAAEDHGMDIEKIAENKLRNAEDYGVNTDEIIRRYNKIIPATIQSFAKQGMTFSGKRVLEEQYQEGSKAYELAGQQRSYERNLADLSRQETVANLQYGRYTEGAAASKERTLEDMNSQLGINQRNTTQDIARQNQLAQRNIENANLTQQEQQTNLTNKQQTNQTDLEAQMKQDAALSYQRNQQNYMAQYPRFKTAEQLSTAQKLGFNEYYAGQTGNTYF